MHGRLEDRRFLYGAVTVAVGLSIGVWITAEVVGSPSELAWILAEWEAAVGHFSISLSRLVEAVLIMLGFGIPLSITSRRLPGLEATITPTLGASGRCREHDDSPAT
jgi:ABC-type nitrate/sulfonate/bicarbonate transport system permease component